MAQNQSAFSTFVRWRPLSARETDNLTVNRSFDQQGAKQSISLAEPTNDKRARTWKSGMAFTNIFNEDDVNSDVHEQIVAPMLPSVLEGGICNLFAYGHSGSGKTHTIIGYDFEDEKHMGLSLRTAHKLFEYINELNENASAQNKERNAELHLAVRLYEVRGAYAYDLLNAGTECHVREGADGQTHIRGKTEMLEDGKVRVRPIVAVSCGSFEDLQQTVLAGLDMRKTGSSSVHDESSRTHAILELEVVNGALMTAREAVIDRESELVPVGKRATDVYIEEQMASLIKKPDGTYMQNPERLADQARIDEAEAEKSKFEARVKEAENAVANCFKNSSHSCLGGKFVFVDLAGSEYFDQSNSTAIKQTPQERKQGRQINTDLFALKEVIRARASKQARIPFRSSPLTMVLRSHFLATKTAHSAMILTVSPAEQQYAATVNTLKYGNLVGLGGS
jgi:hypothetical protein